MSKILFKDKRVLTDYRGSTDLIPFTLGNDDYFYGIDEPNYNLSSWEKTKKSEVWERIVAKMKSFGYDNICVDFRTMVISAKSIDNSETV